MRPNSVMCAGGLLGSSSSFTAYVLEYAVSMPADCGEEGLDGWGGRTRRRIRGRVQKRFSEFEILSVAVLSLLASLGPAKYAPVSPTAAVAAQAPPCLWQLPPP